MSMSRSPSPHQEIYLVNGSALDNSPYILPSFTEEEFQAEYAQSIHEMMLQSQAYQQAVDALLDESTLSPKRSGSTTAWLASVLVSPSEPVFQIQVTQESLVAVAAPTQTLMSPAAHALPHLQLPSAPSFTPRGDFGLLNSDNLYYQSPGKKVTADAPQDMQTDSDSIDDRDESMTSPRGVF
jgi:hypothetical protein